MAYATVKKVFVFDAAHQLPFHKGKCKNLHGHTYRLEVQVRRPVDEFGMVMDFSDIKAIVKSRIIDACDHKFLNDLFSFYTTAENLAHHFFAVLQAEIPELIRVELWETPDSSAIVTIDDLVQAAVEPKAVASSHA
jgi:6-pyruvoyltetrahydropterin/6-carboxytetrahydropterin synthase